MCTSRSAWSRQSSQRGGLPFLHYLLHRTPDSDRRSWPHHHEALRVGGTGPRKGYTAGEVSRAYPEFAAGRVLGPPGTRTNEVGGTPEHSSDSRSGYGRVLSDPFWAGSISCVSRFSPV
jgi:hypothetical protein